MDAWYVLLVSIFEVKRDMASSLKGDLKELLNCSICLDTLTEPKLLPCAHRFCKMCLSQEMKRSTTSGPDPTFPCPLCKMNISLPKGSILEEWINWFQTDRLLKDILERLEDEADDCGLHRLSIEVVCYSCNVTGCVRCAWTKHRHCTRIKIFRNEVKIIENDLKQSQLWIEKCIQNINIHAKFWSDAKKSYRNQERYSNTFIEQCFHVKRDQFKSAYSRLTELYDSYTRTTNMPKQIEINIMQMMEISLEKLDIGEKCTTAVYSLKQRNKYTCTTEYVTTTADTKKMTEVSKNISMTLALTKSEMAIEGQKLLTDNKKVFSDHNQQCQILEGTSLLPSKFILENLITKEDQVDLGIEKEEKLLSELLVLIETAEDPKRLLADLKRLCLSQAPAVRENVKSVAPQIPMELMPIHYDHSSAGNNSHRRYKKYRSDHEPYTAGNIYRPWSSLHWPRDDTWDREYFDPDWDDVAPHFQYLAREMQERDEPKTDRKYSYCVII